MPVAPIAKGVIIAASVITAVGVAFYENPQIREWVDTSRRKIALALHSLGEEIAPSDSRNRRNSAPGSYPNNDAHAQQDSWRRRFAEELRQRRVDLITQAREQGVAVDLNELAAIGEQLRELANAEHGIGNENSNAAGRTPASPARRGRSFDELVDSQGKLVSSSARNLDTAAASTTATEKPDDTLRQRGSVRPSHQEEELLVNPFADTHAAAPQPDTEKTADSHSLLTTSRLSQLDMSFAHATPSSQVATFATTHAADDRTSTAAVAATATTISEPDADVEEENFHSVSEHHDGTGHSEADVLSSVGDEASEAFSDVGGAMTPSSWTEVGSVDGESDGSVRDL